MKFRRELLRISALASALVPGLPGLAAFAQSGPVDEPAVAYQVNPSHSGIAKFAKTNFHTPLKIHWTVDVGGTPTYPLIVDGKVFTTVPNNSSTGSTLLALNETDGKKAWKPVAIPGTYNVSTLAYDAGLIFVLTFDGLLQAFHSSNGTLAWSRLLPGQYAFSAPPMAVNGRVFAGGAGSGGTVYAVDEASGALLWTQGVENGDNSSPTLSDFGVVVTYPCQAYDFAPASGKLLWRYAGPCEGGGGSTPAYFGHRVFARDWASSPNGFIFNNFTGKIEGRLNDVSAIPTFHGDTIYFLSEGTLTAQSISTGKGSWTFAGDGTLVTAPIIVNDLIFIGSSSGNLYALSKYTGALRQTFNLGAAIPAANDQGVGNVTGLNAGEGIVVVPAGNALVAIGE